MELKSTWKNPMTWTESRHELYYALDLLEIKERSKDRRSLSAEGA